MPVEDQPVLTDDGKTVLRELAYRQCRLEPCAAAGKSMHEIATPVAVP